MKKDGWDLLVLAAGLGSRFGGLKQMEGFGPSGETILEYSIYDALRCGMRRVIFVIRKEIQGDFEKSILSRLPEDVDYELVFQELDSLPAEYSVPDERQKPWGTGHAVWVARELLNAPFAVVNGDDFYGRNGFESLAEYFENPSSCVAMVGYCLGDTLSKNGAVSRGVCQLDGSGNLASLKEVTAIERIGGVYRSNQSGEAIDLSNDTPVSLNLFGFRPDFLKILDGEWKRFLKEHGAELKSEFYIPSVVNRIVSEGTEPVPVLPTSAKWFGVTYPDDRDAVQSAISEMVREETYPSPLW